MADGEIWTLILRFTIAGITYVPFTHLYPCPGWESWADATQRGRSFGEGRVTALVSAQDEPLSGGGSAELQIFFCGWPGSVRVDSAIQYLSFRTLYFSMRIWETDAVDAR